MSIEKQTCHPLQVREDLHVYRDEPAAVFKVR